MTNETRAALVLLKEQMTAAEEALVSFDALIEALQSSAFAAGVGAATAEAEKSLSAVRTIARRQAEYLDTLQAPDLSSVIEHEPNLQERMVAVRALRAVRARHEALRERVRSADQLLEKSADFIRYQLNVISGTAADDTYGRSQPVAGPGAGVRREIAMFDADV